MIYILGLEIRLMKKSCPSCYYYEKLCAFGRGKLSALIFKKENPKNFLKKKITPKDIIPDFLVALIPIIMGIILLFIKFNWLILASIIALALLAFPGNGLIRTTLACKFCKQKEIGCPAEQLFRKNEYGL